MFGPEGISSRDDCSEFRELLIHSPTTLPLGLSVRVPRGYHLYHYAVISITMSNEYKSGFVEDDSDCTYILVTGANARVFPFAQPSIEQHY